MRVARSPEDSPWPRRGPAVRAVCALAVWLGGCGGSAPEAPAAPSTPAPAPPSFLHVLSGGAVRSFRSDDATGRLEPTVVQDVGFGVMTGEPNGRFLFVGHGTQDRSPEFVEAEVVAFSTTPQTGSLVEVSRQKSGGGIFGWAAQWVELTATTSIVYGVLESRVGHHFPRTYVAHGVGAEGRLEPPYRDETARVFSEGDPGSMLVVSGTAPGEDVLYKGSRSGELVSYSVAPYGELREVGASHYCVDVTMFSPRPLFAVDGIVYASTALFRGPSVSSLAALCSYTGTSLAPRANLGPGSAGLAASFIPTSPPRLGGAGGPTSPLVALTVGVVTGSNYQVELRLYSVETGGGLRLLDTLANVPWVEGLSFHPSGRYLYVARRRPTLGILAYRVFPELRLQPAEGLDGVFGPMAWTTPGR